MQHQVRTFAGIVFLSVVAGGSAFAAPDATATECLSAPKGEAPAGGHWYYRIDHANKRKCWYVGDASAKVSRKAKAAAPVRSHPAAAPPASAAKEPSPSVSDPRAETRSADAAPEDQKLQESIWPPTPGQGAPRADPVVHPDAAITPPPAPPSAVFQDTAFDAKISTQSVTADTSTFKPVASDQGSDVAPSAAIQPTAAQPPIAAATPMAAASTSNSVPMLLAALACALGLVAIIGAITIKLFDRRRNLGFRAGRRFPRREIWSTIPADEIPKLFPAMSKPENLDDVDRAEPQRGRSGQEVERLLANALKRRAA